MSNNAILDTRPVPPPRITAYIEGKPISFDKLVRDADFQNVVSTNLPPAIFLHNGKEDAVSLSPGVKRYYIAESSLPEKKRERAREMLRRLAYGFHDWAAREVVARYHRDLKRSRQVEREGAERSQESSVRIRQFLAAHPKSTIGEIAKATGVAQPNVSRTIKKWHDEGRVNLTRTGRNVVCEMIAPVIYTQSSTLRRPG